MSLTAGTFSRAMDQLSPVYLQRHTISILGNVLLQDQEVIATDLENYAFARVPDLRLPQPVLVDGKALRKIMKSTRRTEDLIFALDGETISINGMKIEGCCPTEFPTLDFDIGEKISEPFLVDTREIDLVSRACSLDDDRIALRSVNIDLNHSQIVASNGHMLVAKSLVYTGSEPHKERANVLINADAVKFLKPVKGLVTAQVYKYIDKTQNQKYAIEAKWIVFTTQEWTLFAKCPVVEFPDYTQVIPKSSLHRVPFSCERLLDIVKKIKALQGKDKTAYMRLSLSGEKAQVSYRSSNGTIEETVGIPALSTTLQFGFDAHYLGTILEVIARDGDQMVMGINPGKDKDSFQVDTPIRCISPRQERELTIVIMPTRVL